jgi:hypothetical protein
MIKTSVITFAMWCCYLLVFSVKAQNRKLEFYRIFFPNVEIGLGIGATNVKGDISPFPHPLNTRAGGNLFFRYNMNPMTALRIAASFNSLYSADKNSYSESQKRRNFTATNHTAECYVLFEYNFFDFRGRRSYYTFTPYIFAGLGAAYFSFSGTRALKGGNVNVMLPYGVGVKKAFHRNWNYGVEFMTYQTFTDHLDGLTEVNQAVPSFQRGNFTGFDIYYALNFSISYVFTGIICPRHQKYMMESDK